MIIVQIFSLIFMLLFLAFLSVIIVKLSWEAIKGFKFEQLVRRYIRLKYLIKDYYINFLCHEVLQDSVLVELRHKKRELPVLYGSIKFRDKKIVDCLEN